MVTRVESGPVRASHKLHAAYNRPHEQGPALPAQRHRDRPHVAHVAHGHARARRRIGRPGPVGLRLPRARARQDRARAPAAGPAAAASRTLCAAVRAAPGRVGGKARERVAGGSGQAPPRVRTQRCRRGELAVAWKAPAAEQLIVRHGAPPRAGQACLCWVYTWCAAGASRSGSAGGPAEHLRRAGACRRRRSRASAPAARAPSQI